LRHGLLQDEGDNRDKIEDEKAIDKIRKQVNESKKSR